MNTFFSQNLRLLRSRMSEKTSQEKLAELLEIKKPTLGSYESGRAEPKYADLIKIAHFFDVELGPADAEVARVQLAARVEGIFVLRFFRRLQHDRAGEEQHLADLLCIRGAKQQRVHDRVVGHVVRGGVDDVARARGRGGRLHDGVDALDIEVKPERIVLHPRRPPRR